MIDQLAVHIAKDLAGPQEWNSMHGGCEKPCGGFLACGHRCVLKCHSWVLEV